MGKITLITGGARSGKSSYALERAEAVSKKRFFIATCPSLDEEMNCRVTRHKEERAGRGWETFEEERDIAQVVRERLPAEPGVVLLDCITLWVNNILFTAEGEHRETTDSIIRVAAEAFIAEMVSSPHRFFVVTNEVGLGIVPDNRLARLYRDLVGTANQTLGKAADEVVLVSCGIPLVIKKGVKGV
jgi:adenosylcobinamide kinase/adenosylcobinamide-phosphate guanylyltransferase